MGYGVDMQYLEALFGLERHRFPNKLPRVRDGRKILYSAFAVVKIMDALLKEKLPERKPRARGGSEKKLWLSTPEVRKGCSWKSDGGHLPFHGIEKFLLRS